MYDKSGHVEIMEATINTITKVSIGMFKCRPPTMDI
jgi:hypothetical protein